MTEQAISATNGSVIVVPLTYVEDCDGGIHADGTSIVIVWDDQQEGMMSVIEPILKALENQATRLPIPVWTPPPQDQT